MKNLRIVWVALGIVMCAAASAQAMLPAQELSPFTLVQRVGEPHLRYLHMFSTSAGKYTIRHDGFGEVYVAGLRKKNFHLPKPAGRTKIEWIYFHEYEGDLLLLYRTQSAAYLVRLDQKTRKLKGTHTVKADFEPPVIRERTVVFNDGTVVPLS